MKKKLGIILVALLVVALPASASPSGDRTRTGKYNALVGRIDESGPSAEGSFSNAVTFTLREGERYISVAIEDRTGLPVRAVVVQKRVGSNGPSYVVEQEICGRTKAPIRIRAGLDVSVLVQEGPCADGSLGGATFGIVRATFSR